jgi:hypothetical protein
MHRDYSLAHVLFGEPASTPDRVRDKLSQEHALCALSRYRKDSPMTQCSAAG